MSLRVAVSVLAVLAIPAASSLSRDRRGKRHLQGATCPFTPANLHTQWNCPTQNLGPELLVDPIFSTAGTWAATSTVTGEGTFAFAQPGAKVTVNPGNSTGKSTEWHIQMVQNIQLDQGGNASAYYNLCVSASTTKAGYLQYAVDAGAALTFAVAGGGNREQYVMTAGAPLATDCWQFSLDGGFTNFSGRVAVDFGAAPGVVSLCQVSLRRCSTAPMVQLSAPLRRCYLAPLQTKGGCKQVTVDTGVQYGPGQYGQDTSGRYQCLLKTRSAGGDSFVFSSQRCEVWSCGTRNALLQSATGQAGTAVVFSQLCSYQESVAGRMGTEPRAPVFVKLWEWNYNDIAQECQNFLGPNGFTAVQISPVQEHILGTQWWTKYQPVGFGLSSRSGALQDLQSMIATCRAAGVEVLVDVILNHIAFPCEAARSAGASAVLPCTGWGGSPFGNRAITTPSGGKGPEQFHHLPINKMGNCAVNDETWSCPDSFPPNDCTVCDFKGLPDWNTGKSSVQEMLFQHLLQLFELGVTMVRIDAASYIREDDLAAMLYRLPWDYVFQEWWSGMPTPAHLAIGGIRDVNWGLKIANALAVYDIVGMEHNLNISEGVPGVDPVNTIIPLTFHDRRTSDADRFTPTYKNGLEFHQQQKFLLAWPNSVNVRLWGGYGWAGLDDGPPGGCGNGACTPAPVYSGTYGARCMNTPTQSPLPANLINSQSWICEHRWTGVAGLIPFRKACRGLPVTQLWGTSTTPSVQAGRFAFRAGGSCFSALVRGYNTRWPANWGRLGDWNLAGLQTGMPAGRYCDVASVATMKCWDRLSCPREVRIGANGTIITGVVPEGDLLAIFSGATLPETPQAVAAASAAAKAACNPAGMQMSAGSRTQAFRPALSLLLLAASFAKRL